MMTNTRLISEPIAFVENLLNKIELRKNRCVVEDSMSKSRLIHMNEIIKLNSQKAYRSSHRQLAYVLNGNGENLTSVQTLKLLRIRIRS